MVRYVTQRILMIFPIMFAVIFICFTIMNITPGDPAKMLLGDFAPQEAVDMLNRQFGLDKPFFQRFFDYIVNIVTRFDFGLSWRTQRPVVDDILLRFPYTFRIALISVLGSAFIGIPIGVLLAAKSSYWVDRILNILAMIFASIPTFVLAMIAQQIFAVQLRWLPIYGASSWLGYILPLSVTILPASVGRMRMARITLLETIRQDYVTMARSKGVPERRVMFVHAMKNSMIPLITSILLGFSGMLSGSIFIENVFAIPGLGTYMVNSIQMKDQPASLACAIFMSAIFCFTVLLLDIIYSVIDPRIKSRFIRPEL
ncbi:MAG: ABC transporter permease [Symbiobacteriaceae bacterium]|nr:ABC transporter permease [Symbiobacteriaceae bacterium]